MIFSHTDTVNDYLAWVYQLKVTCLMKDEMRQRHRISDSDSQATTCSLDLNWKEKSISLATVNYISHMEIGKNVM